MTDWLHRNVLASALYKSLNKKYRVRLQNDLSDILLAPLKITFVTNYSLSIVHNKSIVYADSVCSSFNTHIL